MRWRNDLPRNVTRMERASSDAKLRENDPRQAREDVGGHLGIQVVLLLLALAAFAVISWIKG